MSKDDQMPVTIELEQVWTLSDDRETVRFTLPALPIEGLPEPLNIFLDFDMETVELMLRRLTVLYARMKPVSPTARH